MYKYAQAPEDRRDQLIAVLEAEPGLLIHEIAQRIGRSTERTRKLARELVDEGVLERELTAAQRAVSGPLSFRFYLPGQVRPTDVSVRRVFRRSVPYTDELMLTLAVRAAQPPYVPSWCFVPGVYT